MEFRSCYKYARISPRKARYVIDLIRGKSVNDALRILRVTHKRASYMIDKVLRAAIATANENLDVDVDSLCVTQALVDCAPTENGSVVDPWYVGTHFKTFKSHNSCFI